MGTILAITALPVAALFENNWGDTEVQRVFLFTLALPIILRGEDLAATEAFSGPPQQTEPA